jgi:hypothetical protein
MRVGQSIISRGGVERVHGFQKPGQGSILLRDFHLDSIVISRPHQTSISCTESHFRSTGENTQFMQQRPRRHPSTARAAEAC